MSLRLLDRMLSLAEDYLMRAKEYRRLASRTDDDLIAACLVELAEIYEEEALGLAPSEHAQDAQGGSHT